MTKPLLAKERAVQVVQSDCVNLRVSCIYIYIYAMRFCFILDVRLKHSITFCVGSGLYKFPAAGKRKHSLLLLTYSDITYSNFQLIPGISIGWGRLGRGARARSRAHKAW